MKLSFKYIVACLAIAFFFPAFAAERFVSFSPNGSDFAIFTKGQQSFDILSDDADYKGVKIALGNLCEDFSRVGGVKPQMVATANQKVKIIVGSIGNNKIIKQLVKSGKIDGSQLNGKREKFVITTLRNPFLH